MRTLFLTFLCAIVSPSMIASNFDSNIVFDNIKPSAVYGPDNREFVSERGTSNTINQLAKSVGVVFNTNDIVKQGSSLKIFAYVLSDKDVGQNVCKEEKFAKYPAIKSACTAFLVGPDLMVSAGHCFDSQATCDYKSVAFDINSNSIVGNQFKLLDKNLYHCKEVLAVMQNKQTKVDFSIIRLDRPVSSDRPALKLRQFGKIAPLNSVFMIGYPLGLPQIYSKDSFIKQNDAMNFFTALIDSFHGNSGSPIINSKTLEVEGVLISGEDDFKFDNVKQCNHYATYKPDVTDKTLKGEYVTRIINVVTKLRSL